MSAYNGENFIEQQIKSVLDQKCVEVRLVVRDDGSTDNTMEILHRIAKGYSEKIQVIGGTNVGIHKSFAELMEFAKPQKSEFVAFADQDDVWDKDKLYRAISQLEEHQADFYSSAARLVDRNLNELGLTTSNQRQNDHYMNKLSGILTPGTQGCTIVLRDIFFNEIREIGIPDYYGHDTWITVVAYYIGKCVYDKVPTMSYRQHDKSWTGDRTNKFKQLIKEYKFFQGGMSRYHLLAKDLLDRFEDKIKDTNTINKLAILSHTSKTLNERLYLIFKSGFSKYGFMQDLIFKFNILIGKV